MNILILNGSLKKRFSASAYFSKLLKFLLWGHKIDVFSLKRKNDYYKILELMKECDAVIISAPLYYDGIPSHILPFLREAEVYCKANPCKCKLYVLSNGGFIEGIQNKLHLEMYQSWCERAHISWGGGVGIGGGVMLHVLSLAIPIESILLLVQVIGFNLSNDLIMIIDTIKSYVGSIGIILFLNIGLIFSLIQLARGVRQKKTIKNNYTRVMIPSFVFLIMADLFMIISALFKGKLIFSLYKKDYFLKNNK